jgi:thiol-disulfide isomerase/thioredoxin
MGGGVTGKALLAVLAIAGWATASLADPRVGQPAASYRFTTSEGVTMTSADFEGKVVIINFWASWCVPCKRELPLLDAFHQKEAKERLAIIAVSDETITSFERFRKLGSTMSIILARAFHGPYGAMGSLPVNYIIDRYGMVRYAKAGAFTDADLERLVEPLLREQVPIEK